MDGNQAFVLFSSIRWARPLPSIHAHCPETFSSGLSQYSFTLQAEGFPGLCFEFHNGEPNQTNFLYYMKAMERLRKSFINLVSMKVRCSENSLHCLLWIRKISSSSKYSVKFTVGVDCYWRMKAGLLMT